MLMCPDHNNMTMRKDRNTSKTHNESNRSIFNNIGIHMRTVNKIDGHSKVNSVITCVLLTFCIKSNIK